MTPGDLDQFFRTSRTAVDDALERLILDSSMCPPLAVEAMRYSLFAGGKRLRPILVLAAAETTARGAQVDLARLAYPAACAIEMIHTYSLVHDDLPAMDDDTLRRGRPTAHVVYGEGLAILAGDALLTEAFRVLARWPDTFEPSVVARKLRVVERMADAAGAAGMVGGQVVDLQAAGQIVIHDRPETARPDGLDAEALRAMHERKTGALIRAAVVAGTVMVGGTDDETTVADQYARHLGLGFQIIDDILDVEGAPDELGKTAGKDAAAGKPTYPSMFGIEESRRLAAAEIGEAKAALERGNLGGRLGAIADWVLSRSH